MHLQRLGCVVLPMAGCSFSMAWPYYIPPYMLCNITSNFLPVLLPAIIGVTLLRASQPLMTSLKKVHNNDACMPTLQACSRHHHTLEVRQGSFGMAISGQGDIRTSSNACTTACTVRGVGVPRAPAEAIWPALHGGLHPQPAPMGALRAGRLPSDSARGPWCPLG